MTAHPVPSALVDALQEVQIAPFDRRLLYYPTLPSTNDVALDLAAEGQVGRIVVAQAQTAGRGRRGHVWLSPPNTGLYVSVVLDPRGARADPMRATQLLTLMAGVAMTDGIVSACGLEAQLKWPNDIFVERRKLGGILAEAAAAPSLQHGLVVLGYGINVALQVYPSELRDKATSLEAELGRSVDVARVCAHTLAALARWYGDLIDGKFDAILDAWRARAPRSRGARVTWERGGSMVSGVTSGIDECGALLVQHAGGEERIIAGEVQWE